LTQIGDLFPALAPALFLFDAYGCHSFSSSNPTLLPE
jgi:hypothetical protein